MNLYFGGSRNLPANNLFANDLNSLRERKATRGADGVAPNTIPECELDKHLEFHPSTISFELPNGVPIHKPLILSTTLPQIKYLLCPIINGSVSLPSPVQKESFTSTTGEKSSATDNGDAFTEVTGDCCTNPNQATMENSDANSSSEKKQQQPQCQGVPQSAQPSPPRAQPPRSKRQKKKIYGEFIYRRALDIL